MLERNIKFGLQFKRFFSQWLVLDSKEYRYVELVHCLCHILCVRPREARRWGERVSVKSLLNNNNNGTKKWHVFTHTCTRTHTQWGPGATHTHRSNCECYWRLSSASIVACHTPTQAFWATHFCRCRCRCHCQCCNEKCTNTKTKYEKNKQNPKLQLKIEINRGRNKYIQNARQLRAMSKKKIK